MVERLYRLMEEKSIAVSPCEHKGTRFLDDPDAMNVTAASTLYLAPSPRGECVGRAIVIPTAKFIYSREHAHYYVCH